MKMAKTLVAVTHTHTHTSSSNCLKNITGKNCATKSRVVVLDSQNKVASRVYIKTDIKNKKDSFIEYVA